MTLVALVVAGAAQAGGEVVPIHKPQGGAVAGFAGPVFAGERMAWAIRRGAGSYLVRSVERDGSDRRSFQARTPLIPRGSKANFSLAASAERLLLGIDEHYCPPACRGSQNAPAQRVFLGYYGGAEDGSDILEQVEPACTAGGDYYDYEGGGRPALQVSGEVVMYRMCGGGVRLRDYAEGATPSVADFPDAIGGRVAGSILAATETSEPYVEPHIAVRNWRSGADLYSVTVPAPRSSDFDRASFDVRGDGTLVTGTDGADDTSQLRVHTAASADGEPVGDFVPVPDPIVRLVGDRVAYWTRTPRKPVVGVRTLGGAAVVPPRVIREATTNLDFDGASLLWGTRPCGLAALAVWDLAGDPPRLPAGKCPFARLVHGTGRVDRKRRVSVVVACPKNPLGCAGAVNGTQVQNRFEHNSFTLDPAERKRVRVTTHKALCIDGQGRTRARITLWAYKRVSYLRRERPKTIVVEGPKPPAPPC
jgi:hypothetical protein